MRSNSKCIEGGVGGRGVDCAAVSIFVVILVELTNTVIVNSTNISPNIEAVLSAFATLILKGKNPCKDVRFLIC